MASTAAAFCLPRSPFRTAGKDFRPPPLGLRARVPAGPVAVKVTAVANNKDIGGVPNTNYVVPLDKALSMARPLNEILRDLNKRVPDNIISSADNSIPWYHVNRMLSFYAPGWCGEVRKVLSSDSGYVTVVYRVTVRGSDGEAHREATGTVSLNDSRFEDPVTAAEELAFCKACARFGFGLYLYHEGEVL